MCKDKVCQCSSGFTGDPFVSCTDSRLFPNNQNCPTNSSGYYLVGNKCIYHEKTQLTWDNAKKGCQDKFSGGGRLYEPLSLQEHNDVHAIIEPLNTRDAFWIGVDDLSQEGSFTYSSSGSKISMNLPWYGQGYSGTRGSCCNCVLLNDGKKELDGTKGSWLDYTCSSSYPSVCESE